MLCHECARDGTSRPAVAHCRFCLVGLCKQHLVESFRSELVPQYACHHHPERPFVAAAVEAARPVAVGR